MVPDESRFGVLNYNMNTPCLYDLDSFVYTQCSQGGEEWNRSVAAIQLRYLIASFVGEPKAFDVI